MTAIQIAALVNQAQEFAAFATDVEREEWLTDAGVDPAPALASLTEAKRELDAMFAFCMESAA